MKVTVYETDCQTSGQYELEQLPKVAMYSWCLTDGREFHAMPFFTFPHLDYIQLRRSGDKLVTIKKNEIKKIYKLF